MPGVEDHRPPDALLRLVNPVLRTLIPSPAGRIVPSSVGVLCFTGRRTGRALRVVAGIYAVDGTEVVITSRPWRLNFAGGRAIEVARSGRRRRGTAELVEDPEQVAAALRAIIAGGARPRTLGLRMPSGHVLDADDVRATRRTLLRLDLG
jgi:hypothetical protein